MTSSKDRPITLLDRPSRTREAVTRRPGDAPSVSHPALPATRQRATTEAHLPAADADDVKPPGRGWGSHEDRRLMLWGLAGFFLLGLYAAAFVTIGALVWT